MTLRRTAIAIIATAAVACFVAAAMGIGELPRITWALIGSVCVNMVLFMGAAKMDEPVDE